MDIIQTPIETYKLNGIDVDVKRDDLVGDGVVFPRWAKIEGIRRILESGDIDKSKPLTHLSVYGSWTGWVLSRLCQEYDIEFISAYPNTEKFPKVLLERVEGNGGNVTFTATLASKDGGAPKAGIDLYVNYDLDVDKTTAEETDDFVIPQVSGQRQIVIPKYESSASKILQWNDDSIFEESLLEPLNNENGSDTIYRRYEKFSKY